MLEEAHRLGTVAEMGVRPQRPRPQPATHIRRTQKRFDLGREEHLFSRTRIVQGLHTVTVAYEMELASAAVPECAGEDSVQPPDEVEAPFLVSVDQSLRTRPGTERMPRRQELCA